jgi:hypothetical protein
MTRNPLTQAPPQNLYRYPRARSAPMNELDKTYYGGGPKGYADYLTLAEKVVA